MPCECGRARCGSINHRRHTLRSRSSLTADGQLRKRQSVWWVNDDGVMVCSDIPENSSILVNIVNRCFTWVKARFHVKPNTSRRSFVVQRPGRVELWDCYLAGTTQIDEYQMDFEPPGNW